MYYNCTTNSMVKRGPICPKIVENTMIWIVEKKQIGPQFSFGVFPHFFYIFEKYFYIFGSAFSLHFHSARLLRKQTIRWSSRSCAAQCKMQRKCRENVEIQKKCGDFEAQSYLWIPFTFFAFSTFLQQLFVDSLNFPDRSNLHFLYISAWNGRKN